MLDELWSGRIFAAHDAFDRERLPVDDPSTDRPNMPFTPHLGYCIAETYLAFYRQGIENVTGFLVGRAFRVFKRPESTGA